MKQTLTLYFNGGRLDEIIEARNPISHYTKHYPRVSNLDSLHKDRRHAEDKLATLRRVVRLMDRYALIACTPRQSSLHALSLGRVPTRIDQRLGSPARNYGNGWDHVSYWRRVGEKAPLAVVTEPYHLDSRTVQAYNDLAGRLNLEYEVSNDYALWNPPHTTAVIWHRAGEYLAETQVVGMAV